MTFRWNGSSIVAPLAWGMNRNTPLGVPARVAVVIATGGGMEPPVVVVPTGAGEGQPPSVPPSLIAPVALTPRTSVPLVSTTALTALSPQLTARWKDESRLLPLRSTMRTKTPALLPARPATVIRPGAGTEPAPVVPMD